MTVHPVGRLAAAHPLLGGRPEATAARSADGDRIDDVRRAGRARRRARGRARPDAPTGPARGRQRRRDRRHLPRRPGRPAPGAADRTGRRRAARAPARPLPARRRPRRRPTARGGAAGHRSRPPPGPRRPAEHLGLHRLAQAGPALAGQRRRQRAQHRRPTSASATPTARSPRCPLHYCYGLSVLTATWSAAPRSCSPTSRSPTRCFWDLAAEAGATSLAGVPYTFELLEASGFGDRRVPVAALPDPGRRPDGPGPRPRLRRARPPPRLGPVRDVRPDRGHRPDGLPAAGPGDLDAPEAVGIPVPGGSFRLDRAGRRWGARLHRAERDDGVRRARRPTSPAAPSSPSCAPATWRARPTTACGRSSAGSGARPSCSGSGSTSTGSNVCCSSAAGRRASWCTTTGCGSSPSRPRSVERTRRAVLEATGLPTSAVRVVHLDKLPQTLVGQARLRRARPARRPHGRRRRRPRPTPATADGIRDLYAVLLGRPDATIRDSFVDLGGDSLSYVEASTRLGQALGTLPHGWQRLDAEDAGGHPAQAPPIHGADRPVGAPACGGRAR